MTDKRSADVKCKDPFNIKILFQLKYFSWQLHIKLFNFSRLFKTGSLKNHIFYSSSGETKVFYNTGHLC